MKTLPAVDVVIVGGGWAGLLMAKELGVRTSLSVVVLERGGPRKTENYSTDMDELDYAIRMHMMQNLSRETVTFRHSSAQRSLPLRQHGAFLPGSGIGGAGEHWNGVSPRMFPDGFELLSSSTQKYGAKRLPQDHSLLDWGVTYDEMEPYYTRAESLLGIAGKAGNLRGQKIDGGNIFEGWRSSEFPMPPNKIPYFPQLVQQAAQSLGYHPFPIPSATPSRAYVNPDGVARPACAYCGFCDRFGCMIGAKAQPSTLLLPVIQRHKNVSIRTGALVRRIVPAAENKKDETHGVTYVDAKGQEFFQPAALVCLASWTFNNTRLLLLSGFGEPYDPKSGKGSLGRNLTHQVAIPAATLFMEKPMNLFMGAGASGIRVGDFDGDVFDHSDLPFLRGGVLEAIIAGHRPIANFGAVPESVKANWGSEWKKAALYYFDRSAVIGFYGEHLAYKTNYFDLDPVYKDSLGDPLLRLTMNWQENERKMAEFATGKAVEIGRAMGAKDITPFASLRDYDATRYQSTHIQGGAIMGASPDRSVVNPYLQHWQTTNLFVLGASAFPQNASANPTLTLLALVLRTADALVDRYLKHPGPLS